MKWLGSDGEWFALSSTEKRKLLKKRMKTEIDPLLRSWGYENPPKHSPGVYAADRPFTWCRRRGEHDDEISMWWRPGRDDTWFAVSFFTTELERLNYDRAPRQHDGPFRDSGSVVASRSRRPWWFGGDEIEWVFNDTRPVDRTIELLRRRLEEVHTYLVTGRRTENIVLPDTPRRLPREEFVTPKTAPAPTSW